MKILIVDDDRTLVHILATRLRAAGWEVALAFDGMQAAMMVQRDLPAVVLLDIGLPGGSGIEVMRRLLLSVKTNTIPVVVMSANSDPALRAAALEMGALGFFAKPVDFERMKALLMERTGQTGPSLSVPVKAPVPVPVPASALTATDLTPDAAPTPEPEPEPRKALVTDPPCRPHPGVPPVVAVKDRRARTAAV